MSVDSKIYYSEKASASIGAYGFSMTSNCLVRTRPAELGVYHGGDFITRKNETFEHLVSDATWENLGSEF